jgi:hypothetical protein
MQRESLEAVREGLLSKARETVARLKAGELNAMPLFQQQRDQFVTDCDGDVDQFVEILGITRADVVEWQRSLHEGLQPGVQCGGLAAQPRSMAVV